MLNLKLLWVVVLLQPKQKKAKNKKHLPLELVPPKITKRRRRQRPPPPRKQLRKLLKVLILKN